MVTKRQVEEILGLYLCCLALVESLLSMANQHMKECLGIIFLYQISEDQGTFGF